MHAPPPDIVLVGHDWKPRALLRAQLIENGLEVLATDTWPDARRQLLAGTTPRLVIVDLQGLPDAETVLSELNVLMGPRRVLVLAAAATLPRATIEQFTPNVLARPVTIDTIVTTVAHLDVRCARLSMRRERVRLQGSWSSSGVWPNYRWPKNSSGSVRRSDAKAEAGHHRGIVKPAVRFYSSRVL